MIEGITRHDFLNHQTAIVDLLTEIEFVDSDKAKRIINRIESHFADYKDFSLFHFSEQRLSGAIFAHRIEKSSEVGRSIKIAYMAVRKQYQGKGIAQLLLEYFISTAKHSFDNIFLTTYENNQRGIKFYTKFQFVPYTNNKMIVYEMKDVGTSNEHRDILFIRRYPLREVVIRPLRTSNIEFLKEMILRSLETNHDLFEKSVLEQREIARYYEGWDSKKEIGFIARHNEKDIGAIWSRKLPYYNQGFGYVEDSIPEMGLGVYYEYRGRGLGQLLMDHLFARLRHLGETAVSTYVSSDSPAKRAFLRNGFNPVRREDKYLVLLKKL